MSQAPSTTKADGEPRQPDVRPMLPLLLLGLLLAVGLNYHNLTRLVRGDVSVGGLLTGETNGPPMIYTVSLPDDIGPADAPLKLEVLVHPTGECDCSASTVYLALAVGQVLSEQLRVEFIDATSDDGRWRLKEVGTSPNGLALALDGKVGFDVTVPDAAGKPQDKHVDLAAAKDLTTADLWAVLNQALRAKDLPDLGDTSEDFEQQVTDALSELHAREAVKVDAQKAET